MIALYQLTRAQLETRFQAAGLAAVHARSAWRYLYQKLVSNPAEMTDLPGRARDYLSTSFAVSADNDLQLAGQIGSDEGQTQKYLLQMPDGAQVETVEMRYRDRVTVCVSSQVGCALGCVFCATGQQGFTRDLTAGEIVAQAVFVARRIRERGERVRNVVFMGMGEPLLNLDAVLTAAEILRDPGGFAIGAKQLTISTVGVVPGIRRLIAERAPYSLAVSLHAATQAERIALVPAARPWPLEELMDACREYCHSLGKRIFFEWTLIAGQNDSPTSAQTLAQLLQGIPAHVNLIPLNPTAGFRGQATLSDAASRFQAILAAAGIPTTIRQRRGIDIAGGCGQLAGQIA